VRAFEFEFEFKFTFLGRAFASQRDDAMDAIKGVFVDDATGHTRVLYPALTDGVMMEIGRQMTITYVSGEAPAS